MLKFHRRLLVASSPLTLIMAVAAAALAITASGDTTADRVLGQPDFVHTFQNLVDSKGLWGPSAVTVDRAGHVYVADSNNNRVLGWANFATLSNGAPADLLIGQSSFNDTGGGSCLVPTTAANLCAPGGLATDSQGNLYVVDRGNSRVVAFSSPFNQCAGTPCIIGNAEAVFGQSDFVSNRPNRGGGPTAQSLSFPTAVAIDGSDDLFLADQPNNRVLEFLQPLASSNHCNNTFPCADPSADTVYGQTDFVSNSASSNMNFPAGVWVDGNSNVYIADLGNFRVVEYNAPSGNNPAPSTVFEVPDAHGFFDMRPIAVAVDPSGDLYVTDNQFQRIVEFNQPLTSAAHCNNSFPCTVQNADAVFGQTSTSSGCNQGSGSTSPNSQDLCEPMGVGVDQAGNLYAADSGNNRVLGFKAPLTSANGCDSSFPCFDVGANLVLGQVDFIYNTANLVDAVGLSLPTSVAVDSMNHIYVSDNLNGRVLGWANASSLANGAPADLVIGQPNFYSSELPPMDFGGCTVPTSASTLCGPSGIAVDTAGNLYVADEGESRVLEYDTPFAGCANLPCVGPAAHMIVGQNDASGNKCNKSGGTLGIGPGTLCDPTGVAVDAVGNLFVSDSENSRVLEYNNPLAVCAAGQCIAGNANVVFGQADFSSPYCNGLNPTPSASSLCFPGYLALDKLDDLFVVDGNNRVLEYYQPLAKAKGYGTGDTIADKVWGQNGSFSTALCNLGTNSPSASSLCGPSGVAVDSEFDVFIADGGVLEYDHRGNATGSTTATLVLGQPSFTGPSCGTPASASSLCNADGMALDSVGDLWVSDSGNSRVLEYLQPLASQK